MKKQLLSLLCLVIFTTISQAQDPILWGMTTVGGIYDEGTIFYCNASSGIENVMHDFGKGSDGTNPSGSLIQANNGLLYGMTISGGAYNWGALFSYNISTGVYAILHDFGSTEYDGKGPYGSLFQASNGALYGMTSHGGIYDTVYNGGGTIFSYDIASGNYTVLHSFGKDSTDGLSPYGNLM